MRCLEAKENEKGVLFVERIRARWRRTLSEFRVDAPVPSDMRFSVPIWQLFPPSHGGTIPWTRFDRVQAFS